MIEYKTLKEIAIKDSNVGKKFRLISTDKAFPLLYRTIEETKTGAGFANSRFIELSKNQKVLVIKAVNMKITVGSLVKQKTDVYLCQFVKPTYPDSTGLKFFALPECLENL